MKFFLGYILESTYHKASREVDDLPIEKGYFHSYVNKLPEENRSNVGL